MSSPYLDRPTMSERERNLYDRMIAAEERANGSPLPESRRRLIEQAARDTERAIAHGEIIGRFFDGISADRKATAAFDARADEMIRKVRG